MRLSYGVVLFRNAEAIGHWGPRNMQSSAMAKQDLLRGVAVGGTGSTHGVRRLGLVTALAVSAEHSSERDVRLTTHVRKLLLICGIEFIRPPLVEPVQVGWAEEPAAT